MTSRTFLFRSSASALFVSLAVLAVLPASSEEPALENEDDKLLYTLGLALSQRLLEFELTPEETALVQAGFADGSLGSDARVPIQEYGPKLDAFLKGRMGARTDREKEAGRAFTEEFAAENPTAVKTDSGALYLEIETGEGPNPTAADKVKLHYHGTLINGDVFDSSVEKNSPATFGVSGVVPCFSEGVQKMKVGGKAKLVCPSDTAYGDRGSPPVIVPGATLIFEVELLEINPGATTAPASGDGAS